jgi:hypothetical protein
LFTYTYIHIDIFMKRDRFCWIFTKCGGANGAIGSANGAIGSAKMASGGAKKPVGQWRAIMARESPIKAVGD